MTQREIDKRTGLKGRTRTFMIPVSESKFSGDRVIFQDTGSVRLDYSVDNKNGFPFGKCIAVLDIIVDSSIKNLCPCISSFKKLIIN